MAIGIDEIDDDDLILDDPQNDVSEFQREEDEENDDHQENQVNENQNEDALSQFLKDNGIEDLNKIKFSDENGDIQERSWKELSSEEQLNILRSSQKTVTEDVDLDQDEINFLNSLREKGISPSQYIQDLNNSFQQQLESVQKPEPAKVFTSDQFSDDELFILDLQNRIPDITDDEVIDALNKAKENEDFYKKQMSGIRAEYQRLEEETKEREEAINLQQQQEAYEQYSNTIINEIANFQNVGDLDVTMDSDDMDELASFILASDDQGNNYFQQALQDPKTLVQMAWFALHGEEIFNGISDYYNKEIQKASREGFARGKASVKPENKATVVIQPKTDTTKNNSKQARSIEDLDDDV